MTYYTLITGASSGIGLELAFIAARDTRNLVLVSRDEKELQSVRDQIVKQSKDAQRVEIFAVDLSSSEAAKKVFEFCKKKNLVVNELINNAGFGDYGEFSKSDLNRQLSMIDLNVRAVTELTHLFLPAMVKNKTGKIMNLGSVASFLPGPTMSVYYASKNYVLRFSEALSEELSGTGVSVTCLCPGPTKTNFASSARADKTGVFKGNLPTAREVAEFGWYHMQHGTRVAVHGVRNRALLYSAKFIPRNLVTKLVKKIQM